MITKISDVSNILENDQAQKTNAMSQAWETLLESCYLSKIRDLRTLFVKSLKVLATTSATQYNQYLRVTNLVTNLNFRRGNHPSFANNALFVNLNMICVIQIISATLLVISITESKNTEPLPLVHTVCERLP